MAGYLPLEIEQFATFSRTIVLKTATGAIQNLVGGVANTSMKRSYYSTSANTVDTTITDAPNGVITLSMTSTNTANLVPGRYVYDVKLSLDGSVQRVIEGIIVVNPGVTE